MRRRLGATLAVAAALPTSPEPLAPSPSSPSSCPGPPGGAAADALAPAWRGQLLRCFSREQLAAATLEGEELERHYREVLEATAPWREEVHGTYEDVGGPWIESWWVDRLCCNRTRDPALFGRFVPLFVRWLDHQMASGTRPHAALPRRVAAAIRKILRRDVLYVAVTQHDDGVEVLREFPNVLLLSAGGVGHVPLPLLKGESRPAAGGAPFGGEAALLFAGGSRGLFHGRARDLLQPVLDAALPSSGLRATHSFKGGHAQWMREMGRARFVLAPRGNGRSTFALAEALQAGHVPVYVWDDVRWLPYGRLWDEGLLGYEVQVSHFSEALTWLREVNESEHARRRQSILGLRRHFTYKGVIEEIVAFLRSDGTEGLLRCETAVPMANGVRPALLEHAARALDAALKLL